MTSIGVHSDSENEEESYSRPMSYYGGIDAVESNVALTDPIGGYDGTYDLIGGFDGADDRPTRIPADTPGGNRSGDNPEDRPGDAPSPGGDPPTGGEPGVNLPVSSRRGQEVAAAARNMPDTITPRTYQWAALTTTAHTTPEQFAIMNNLAVVSVQMDSFKRDLATLLGKKPAAEGKSAVQGKAAKAANTVAELSEQIVTLHNAHLNEGGKAAYRKSAASKTALQSFEKFLNNNFQGSDVPEEVVQWMSQEEGSKEQSFIAMCANKKKVDLDAKAAKARAAEAKARDPNTPLTTGTPGAEGDVSEGTRRRSKRLRSNDGSIINVSSTGADDDDN